MLDLENALDAVVEQPVVEGAEPEVVVDPDVEPDIAEPVVDEPNPDDDKDDDDTTDEPAADEPVKDEPAPEPVTFDADSPEFLTQANETLEKYDLTELPDDLQALIPALIAKANAPVNDGLSEFAAYALENAEPEVIAEAVKSRLDRQALLEGVERTENGQFRPKVKEFVETLSPDTVAWMSYETSKLPSTQYPGITLFEEHIVNAWGKEGEPVAQVLARYNTFSEAMTSGAMTSEAPEFIPQQIREAYWSLSKDERDEYAAYDPTSDRFEDDANGRPVNIDEPIRLRKLETLAKIQKGIDSDKSAIARDAQTKQAQAQAFTSTVIDKQVKFYDAFREQFTKDLVNDVVFSTDPKMQGILATQHVALLENLFEGGAKGESARKALADSGITFDVNKAQTLMSAVEEAAVALTIAEQTVDSSGKQLDEIALNKAAAQFRTAGKNWQDTAKDVLGQLSRLTSTGKAEEVKTEVAKQKVALKARPATKGAPSAATKIELKPPSSVPYGSPEWDQWWAKQTLQEIEAKKARQYA